MDFNGLLVIAAIWFLVSLLGGGRRKKPAPSPVPQRQPDRPAQPGLPDATQREGRRLESVLREFERALGQAGPGGRSARVPLPRAEEVEARESQEMEPEGGSLETEVRREARRPVDQDDEAEQIVARRIKAAAARDKVRSKADHAEFDKRIRQEVADKTAAPRYTTQQLRDAVVWREILGPPVSMREEVRSEK